MDQIWPFVQKHWHLSLLFVALLLWVIYEEVGGKFGGAKRVSPAQATQLVNRENAQLLDIRSQDAFVNGHIAGAKHIQLADLKQQVSQLDQKRPVIVYCERGVSAVTAVKQLKQQEFESVYLLSGGLTAWREASLPVVKK